MPQQPCPAARAGTRRSPELRLGLPQPLSGAFASLLIGMAAAAGPAAQAATANPPAPTASAAAAHGAPAVSASTAEPEGLLMLVLAGVLVLGYLIRRRSPI